MQKVKHFSLRVTFLSTCILLTACNDDHYTVSSSNQGESSSSKTLAHIDVSPTSATVYTSQSFTAIGRYSDGTQADISSSVSWQSSNTGVADLNSAGLLTPRSAGSINVTASLSGVTSAASTATVVASVVCGHTFGSAYSVAVDNSSNTIATGACVKLAQNGSGNWFTSAPSYPAVQAIVFTPLDLSEVGDGSSGPNNGRFMLFNWFDSNRWCTRLNEISFAGRTDWTMPTLTQLSGLHTDKGNMFTGYGWPVGNYTYWGSTLTGNNYDTILLSDGSTGNNLPDSDTYSTCISTSS